MNTGLARGLLARTACSKTSFRPTIRTLRSSTSIRSMSEPRGLPEGDVARVSFSRMVRAKRSTNVGLMSWTSRVPIWPDRGRRAPFPGSTSAPRSVFSGCRRPRHDRPRRACTSRRSRSSASSASRARAAKRNVGSPSDSRRNRGSAANGRSVPGAEVRRQRRSSGLGHHHSNRLAGSAAVAPHAPLQDMSSIRTCETELGVGKGVFLARRSRQGTKISQKNPTPTNERRGPHQIGTIGSRPGVSVALNPAGGAAGRA